MNKTEKKAYDWLVSEGYKEIVFQYRHSPDFLVYNGKGFEAKLIRHNAITFSKTQIENLNAHSNVTMLLFDDEHYLPIDIVSYKEISLTHGSIIFKPETKPYIVT